MSEDIQRQGLTELLERVQQLEQRVETLENGSSKSKCAD